jgi:hypothetical protein
VDIVVEVVAVRPVEVPVAGLVVPVAGTVVVLQAVRLDGVVVGIQHHRLFQVILCSHRLITRLNTLVERRREVNSHRL